MRYTNKYGIPEPICRAMDSMGYDLQPSLEVISANALVDSPRRRILSVRHYNDIVVDYSWRLWEFLGNACHLAMEKGALKTLDAITERRIYMKLSGKLITGKPDWVEPSKGLLLDHKVTRVYAFILERALKKWEEVLNIYIFLLRRKGINITTAKINGILRDWDASLIYKSDMPDMPFIGKNIKIWTEEEELKFIMNRLEIHKQAEKYEDDKLPLCTPDERWAEKEKWAVYGKSKKRAYRVYDYEIDAIKTAKAMTEKKKVKYEVIKRDMVNKRCTPRYCHVAPFCNYYRTLQGVDNDEML